MHNNVVNDALNLDIAAFCTDLSVAARKWYIVNFQDALVKANRAALMKWHENGLSPYVVGTTVLS